MSIQDDIFDVESILEGTPEDDAFDRIITRFAQFEKENQSLRNDLMAIIRGEVVKARLIKEWS